MGRNPDAANPSGEIPAGTIKEHREMRKLFVLAAMVMAALAFSASAASAAPVEVEDDSEGVMCNDTVAGECPIHIVSTGADLVVHTIFGEITYDCNVEIDAEVHSNGSGATHQVDIRDGASTTCNEDLIPCEQPWPASTDHTGSTEILHTDLCINPPIIDVCEGVLHANLVETAGEYSSTINDSLIEGTSFPRCEFTGNYSLENSEDIEIHHL
jgi:hypothetical protein